MKTTKLFRFGVSLDKKLLDEFDSLIEKRNYPNRSEAFRDLIRQELVKEEWDEHAEVVGVITLVYDHHIRELVNKLTEIQHGFQKYIISTQHIHLDHDNCLEIIASKGAADKVIGLADTLKSVKGVKHGALSMSSTGKNLK
jgi:CopG family transcriptional regulator, nickel-responsive regulator